MNSAGVLRALVAAACLGVGAASANGTEPGPDSPNVAPLPPPAVMLPAATSPAPVSPVWVQVPAGGARPYVMVPQAAMPWVMAPAHPVMLPMQTVVPPGWVPFMVVLVPVQAPAQGLPDYGPVSPAPVVVLPTPDVPAAAPAAIDYSPLSETPVVVLPAPDAQTSPPAAIDYGPVSEAPVVMLPLPDASPGTEAAEAVTLAPAQTEAVVQPVASVESFVAPAVDYGPVASTPVVSLLADEQATTVPPHPAVKAKARSRRSGKPAVRKATAKPRAAAQPVKKRMCWSNGIVAPCR